MYIMENGGPFDKDDIKRTKWINGALKQVETSQQHGSYHIVCNCLLMTTLNSIAVLKQQGSAFDFGLSSTLAPIRCLCTVWSEQHLQLQGSCKPSLAASKLLMCICFHVSDRVQASDCCSSTVTLQHGVQVKTAVQNGYDLRGYHYWTLLDNYEWNFAYQHKFGLYKWDREDPDGKRTLRNGSKVSNRTASEMR